MTPVRLLPGHLFGYVGTRQQPGVRRLAARQTGDSPDLRSQACRRSALTREPPARGERRFHGQPGHFPAAAVRPSCPPWQGLGLLAPGWGLWRLEVWGRADLGKVRPAPPPG